MIPRVTVVAFYGDKPPALAAAIQGLQGLLSSLSPGYVPHPMEQVHATIAGLEAQPQDGARLNANFRALRGEDRVMQRADAVRALRDAPCWPLELQWGGFDPDVAYPFASRGQHPYRRAFSVQGELAVAIAWPRATGSLAQLRLGLERHGVLHKYHAAVNAADDDLFFVLGRCTQDPRPAVEAEGRELMRRTRVSLQLTAADLSLVQYVDPTLPLSSSVARPLLQLTAAELAVR